MAASDTFNDVNLLGRSVALIPQEHDPFDLSALDGDKSIIVNLIGTKEVTFADNQKYSIPKNVQVRIGNRRTETHSLQVDSGHELAKELDTKASMSGSYAGFSASASAQYSYSSSMSENKYYALLSVNHTSFTLELEGHEATDSNINPSFINAVEKLPEWEVTDGIYDQYIDFFRKWGTHVIKSCTFGARYQLKVENDATKSHSKEDFQAQVSAEYNGVASVKGDASLKGSTDYKDYRKSRTFHTNVYGGSSSTSMILSNAPDDAESYRDAFNGWAKSLDSSLNNNLVNLRVDSISNLLKNSSNPEHQRVSGKLLKAQEYLSSMRCAQGTLNFETSAPSSDLGLTQALRITGAPGISIKGIKLPYALTITATLRIPFPLDWAAELALEGVYFHQISANHLEVSFSVPSLENIMKSVGSPGNQSNPRVKLSIKTSIIAPPSPVSVELLSSSLKMAYATLDLSPRGPKLTASGDGSLVFKARSLFRPGNGSQGYLIGACFAE